MSKRGKQSSLIAGLDIGSSMIRMAVGSVVEGPQGPELHILAAADSPSSGVHRGVVTSIEDTVSSIAAVFERTERLVGVPVEHAWVGISGTHVQTQQSRGTVAVAQTRGEITTDDVERAVDNARTVATPLNYEILHVIPQSFTVDDQKGLKNPVGMSGVRLEVDAQIVQGVSAHIKNITRAVYRTGLDIDDVVLGVLAAGEAVLSARQKELGVVVVNIGSTTTGVAVYEDGDLLHAAVLPIGSGHITNDLAIGLRTDIDVADAVKIRHGSALAAQAQKKDQVNLRELGALSDEMVSLKYIAEITQARVEEIFDKVDDTLEQAGRSGKLPAGVVLTGAGSSLGGIVELAKAHLRLPAQLGYPVGINSVTDRAGDLGFVTAVGLVKWGQQAAKESYGGRGSFEVVDKTVGQIKGWFGSLLP